MKTLFRTALIAAAVAAATTSFAAGVFTDKNTQMRPSGRGFGIVDESAAVSGEAAACSSGICYHGGPVMLNQTQVYYIWYGNWAGHSVGQTALADMINGLSGSPIYGTNTTYTNKAGKSVSNSVVLAGQINDTAMSQGKALTDAKVESIITTAISSGKFPQKNNAVYFLLTAPDVTLSGFGTQYCGWHTYTTMGTMKIKYSFVGNAATQAPSGCGASGTTPNGDAGIDGMASVVFHELSEAVSDPVLNAWSDTSGMENADKCAWTFGTLYTTPNGAKANVLLGSKNYKLQQNWVHAGAGYCGLKI